MSNVDMGWARFMPTAQTITAQPANWERPRFDTAGALMSAQRYLAQQQQMDLAKQEAPLTLEAKRLAIEGQKHDLSRQGVADQFQDIQLSNAKQGVADDAATHDVRLQAEITGFKAQVKQHLDALSAPDKTAFAAKTEATANLLTHVFSYPDGSAEQKGAWDESIKGLSEHGFLDQGQADQYLKSGPDRNIARLALTADEVVKDALKTASGGGTSYDDLPFNQKARIETMAKTAAQAKVQFGEAVTDEAIAKERQAILAQMGIRVRGSAYGSIVKDQGDYEGKTRPIRKGDKVSEGASDRGAVTAEKKPGQTRTRGAKGAAPPEEVGGTPSKAHRYTGDPNDEPAQYGWFASIPVDTWFINPHDGIAHLKKKPLPRREE